MTKSKSQYAEETSSETSTASTSDYQQTILATLPTKLPQIQSDKTSLKSSSSNSSIDNLHVLPSISITPPPPPPPLEALPQPPIYKDNDNE